MNYSLNTLKGVYIGIICGVGFLVQGFRDQGLRSNFLKGGFYRGCCRKYYGGKGDIRSLDYSSNAPEPR